MTQDYFDSIGKIVADVVSEYFNDIEASHEVAYSRIAMLPGFDEWKDSLVRRAICKIVNDYRSKCNGRMKSAIQGDTAQPPPKAPASIGSVSVSNSVAEVYDEANDFSYFLAGTTLGAIRWCEIDEVAESEKTKGDGHYFNWRLLSEIKKAGKAKTPADSRIDQAISPLVLRKIFRKLLSQKT